MSASPILSCANVHRYLGAEEGRVHAVRGVSLELRAGQSCAVVGPSGCGKSTLLYALGLLDRPDEGDVRVGGEELARADDRRRTRVRSESIGFVFQFHFLLLEFSALENVVLPMLHLGNLSRNEAEARGRQLLDRVGLAEKAGRRANHLSGGEQQRIAVARSLANSPAVVLADEPTGNLDAANAEGVIDLLIGLAGEEGRGAIIVTHNPEIAARCDVTLRMEDGRIVEGGMVE